MTVIGKQLAFNGVKCPKYLSVLNPFQYNQAVFSFTFFTSSEAQPNTQAFGCIFDDPILIPRIMADPSE